MTTIYDGIDFSRILRHLGHRLSVKVLDHGVEERYPLPPLKPGQRPGRGLGDEVPQRLKKIVKLLF